MTKSILAAGAILSLLATAGLAEERTGQQEYMIACAGCHGETGKGDGPAAASMTTKPYDLTKLTSEKGGGTFPFEYALWIVDGRDMIKFHGGDMPVWGDRYMVSARASEAESETPESRELVVRGRILSLVYYLGSIQE
ncbi:c-type cytochrome [Thalassovita mangrovi]|uniref:Cytochrome c n=1 Tax=Thalassovita mangrovi TaxID=2692236 RepID=A0A6L8LPZ4_9RHOB|nr:c-type cytochrome [Thalassovita mangrovi]MYM55632.1 cytochrome c [Thalassovita mangrovi]